MELAVGSLQANQEQKPWVPPLADDIPWGANTMSVTKRYVSEKSFLFYVLCMVLHSH